MSADARAAAWDEALCDATRLALAEGERAAGEAIAALPHPARLPARQRGVRRLALLYAALVARSVARHWDLSRQIADLPGGPSFGRSLAPWETLQLRKARWHGPADEVFAGRWYARAPPVRRWGAVWLHLAACLLPLHLQRARPTITISPQPKTLLTEIAQRAAEQAASCPRTRRRRHPQVGPTTRDDRS